MNKFFLLATLLSLAFNATAQSAQSTQRLAQFNLSDKTLAIEGYDPVSYFSGKPAKGKTDHSVQHQGVVYRFASTQNKEAFLKSPASYEPQYGGWCAYAMGSKGTKVSVDPETYKIVAGKLYLFYNSFLTNTLKPWNKNEPALMKAADASWSKFYL